MATEKARALRGVSPDDLQQKEAAIKEELFNLRFQQKVGQIENPLKIRTLRKELARVLTVKGEKRNSNKKNAAEGK
ncbi:MAG: 50S ribosomal protein L29 [Fibrobacteres bacterium]|nr:50S ribosomal protein L29 [Fibrobacterota bacterium]